MSSKIDVPAEMRLKYIERRRQDVNDCTQALQRQDFELLSKVGHQLKGNAATFGYADLTQIASDMEKYALEKNSTQLIGVMQRFADYVAQM